MGPKVKKPPKNSFSFFLDDYVESQRIAGRNVSYKIAAEECGPLWKALPEEEKHRYGNLAAAHKVYSKNDKKNKFTSTGISYAQLEKEQEELRLKNESADEEMRKTVADMDYDMLKTHLFYIVHCNYYCKTDEGLYVPGEIAVVEFSLKDGIRKTFHTLINPGQIPLGYANEAKQSIEEIHCLPYPPYDEGDSDYFGIFQKILSFIEPGMLPDGRYPPLYCIENNIKASEYILQALSDNADEKNFFRVYLLHKMFFWLKNKCVESFQQDDIGFPVMSNAETEVNKDVFCYAPQISCAFHTACEEKYQNCSLSVVQRYVYLICDHCCQYLNIDLVPGKHCRHSCRLNINVSRGQLMVPNRSSSTSEVYGGEYDGRSSYCGESSIHDFRQSTTGSFLQDELEDRFSSFEVSSFCSKSTRKNFTPVSFASSDKSGLRKNESDEDEAPKTMSFGRGINRH